jgi:CxxC motif-containing protein (DUF1111 family)
MLSGFNAEQFQQGSEAFAEPEGIADGLGPLFNLDSCGGCHSFPALGGSSPASNPQVAIATAYGAQNSVPSFITSNGPIREVRFQSDGQVHALYVISGRADPTGNASDCHMQQENFGANPANLRFRIPTPVFGAGLIEQIPDSAIRANRGNHSGDKQKLGIRGDVQTQGNSGNNLGRFGWKAQHANLENFAGEAYNVEMGITNALSPTERNTACQYAPVPNDLPPADGGPSDVELFTAFMRGLAAPTPSPDTPGGAASIARGQAAFSAVGCDLCHTPTLAGVPLYSDLLLHSMGSDLADDITQGDAGPDQFRTAPLWGVGQRLFFLHDGRTSDLLQAIRAHASAGSEAQAVITNFNKLDAATMQDVLNFLRSL